MIRTFTWTPAMTQTFTAINEEFPGQATEFALAIANYGTYGMKHEFSNDMLKYAFIALKSEIDCEVLANASTQV